MENLQEEKKIEIGSEMLSYLNTTRKWTMFFAILGFIFIGLMLIGTIVAGFLIRSAAGLGEAAEGIEGMENIGVATGVVQILLIVVILVFALIYFFPVFYLLKFSLHSSKAVKTLSSEELSKAFRYMKSYWLYLGVLMIIILAVYLIIFLVAGSSIAILSGLKA
ncbi:MAG: hypothetical protein ACUVTX_01710 [Bacteroidales bacterium]